MADGIKKVALMRLFTRRFKLIVLVILIVLLFASYFLLIGPKLDKIRTASQVDLKEKSEELQSRKTYLNDLKSLLANYQKLTDEEIRRINLVLPSEKDLPGIFVQLEALAEKNGLMLNVIDISTTTEKKTTKKTTKKTAGKIKRLDVAMSLGGGDYYIFKKFLDDLEYNIRIFDVSSTSFSPDFTSYFINLRTYYFAE